MADKKISLLRLPCIAAMHQVKRLMPLTLAGTGFDRLNMNGLT